MHVCNTETTTYTVFICISAHCKEFRKKINFSIVVLLLVHQRHPLYLFPSISDPRGILYVPINNIFIFPSRFFLCNNVLLQSLSSFIISSICILLFVMQLQYLLLSNNITCISLIRHVSHIFSLRISKYH
jgi:hypothetical protein